MGWLVGNLFIDTKTSWIITCRGDLVVEMEGDVFECDKGDWKGSGWIDEAAFL